MSYERLDNEELLFAALDAMNGGRHGEAVNLLKILLHREPEHLNARYLLSAEHAQLGMFPRAEAGLRALLEDAPDFAIARFQLGQLLLMRDAREEVRTFLAPLNAGQDALAAYARALCAVADEDAAVAVRELDTGLALPQPVPSLVADMQALRERFAQLLRSAPQSSPDLAANAADADAPVARMFMTGYGRGG